jgi:glutamate synthase domain-containing protein 3
VFRSVTPIGRDDRSSADRLIRWNDRENLAKVSDLSQSCTLFIDCTGFEPQGEDSASRLLVKAYQVGWRKFVVFGCRGDRFIGCGLGAKSDEVRIDVYGSGGDYLASGLDGGEVHVHGDAQDQVGQIMKSGKLVIYGMVGQTFLYGAKGGVAYVLGNAAGRPLINAVGHIRTIINGTALDYAAESFMAGATTDGGFLIINGVILDDQGRIVPLADRYPGGNFFSLASGGAGYINDPDWSLSYDQLNGGEIVSFEDEDWSVIEPYLKENEELFGLTVAELLNGHEPNQIYRKVIPERHGSAKKIDAHT